MILRNAPIGFYKFLRIPNEYSQLGKYVFAGDTDAEKYVQVQNGWVKLTNLVLLDWQVKPIEILQTKEIEPPIMIGSHKVEFLENSIKVGCHEISFDVINQINARMSS